MKSCSICRSDWFFVSLFLSLSLSLSPSTLIDSLRAAQRNHRTATRSRAIAQYVSPEILKPEQFLRDREIGPETDIWAFGCIVYQMFAGRPPFTAGSDYLIFQQILKLEFSFPDEFPPAARDLVQKILVLEPSQRLGAAAGGGYASLRAHPFFAGVAWDALSTATVPPLRAAPYAAALLEAQRSAAQLPSERARLIAEQAKSAWCVLLCLVVSVAVCVCMCVCAVLPLFICVLALQG